MRRKKNSTPLAAARRMKLVGSGTAVMLWTSPKGYEDKLPSPQVKTKEFTCVGSKILLPVIEAVVVGAAVAPVTSDQANPI